MLNHVRSWLFVDRLSRPVVVLDRLPGLYGLKYDSATACRLPLYLCSYKLVGSATPAVSFEGSITSLMRCATSEVESAPSTSAIPSSDALGAIRYRGSA